MYPQIEKLHIPPLLQLDIVSFLWYNQASWCMLSCQLCLTIRRQRDKCRL